MDPIHSCFCKTPSVYTRSACEPESFGIQSEWFIVVYTSLLMALMSTSAQRGQSLKNRPFFVGARFPSPELQARNSEITLLEQLSFTQGFGLNQTPPEGEKPGPFIAKVETQEEC